MNALTAKLTAYCRLLRLDKPIGIYLLLWPGLWSLWIAGEGRPHADVFLIILLGTVLMRSAGCVINDYADRKIDPHVERTRLRPIAAGLIQPREALYLFALLCVVALILVFQANTLTRLLSIPGAFLAASYPFMKRYTHWPQAYLGLAFGWAVPMAFAAETGSIPLVAWELYLATISWALVYDTQYAMVDREDDLKLGVKSTAILFGSHDRLIIGGLQILTLLILGRVGMDAHLGYPYHVGLIAAGISVTYQQWLIRHRDPIACFQAFQANNDFGLMILVGVVLNYSLK
ncbi:MAG: 4-hydroxybenzoate octaprenyltransferase [Methylococcaceae bacterium]